MQYCLNHPEEISKLSKLKAQITEVKGIMMDNIEKVYVSSFVERNVVVKPIYVQHLKRYMFHVSCFVESNVGDQPIYVQHSSQNILSAT